MSSRIKIIHLDTLAALKTIKEGTKDLFKYFNVWNDQIDNMISGKSYSFMSPACFIEFQMGEPVMLGKKVTSYPNCRLRIHIAHMYLNDNMQNMERNLAVMDIRDKVKEKLLSSSIRYCSGLQLVEESPDYMHDAYYEYILGFSTNFIDSKGSIFDDESGLTWGKIYGYELNIVKTYENEDSDPYQNEDGKNYITDNGTEYKSNIQLS